MTDRQILEEYRNTRDTSYLSQLFIPYVDMIYGLGLKYFKNADDAKDLVNDIYLVLGKKIISHRIQNFKPWLYTVVKNHCIENLRKRGRKIKKEDEATFMYYEGLFHLDNEESEKKNEILEKCIDKLKVDQKNSIKLFYFEKKSYEEISEMLNLSWGQIRSSIQNARRNLKLCLSSHGVSR